MKKKIKDVTFGDIAKECVKQKKCLNCSFYFYERCIISYLDHGNLPQEWPENELGILEEEVEIE